MKARPKYTFDEGDDGKPARLKPGERFVVELRSVPHRYGWKEPVIEGAAVVFVGKDVDGGPPPGATGGSYRHRFQFCGAAAGTATVIIPQWDDTGSPSDFRLKVTVR